MWVCTYCTILEINVCNIKAPDIILFRAGWWFRHFQTIHWWQSSDMFWYILMAIRTYSDIFRHFLMAYSDIFIAGRLKFFQLNFVDVIWVFLFWFIRQMRGTNKSQDGGKEDKAVEQAKHHHQKEHFEEYHEWVVIRCCQQDYSKQGGQPAIKHCWTNL